MRYDFEPMPGWIRRSYPAPQRGIYLGAPPATPRASILLMDSIEPVGTLEQQVAGMLLKGCVDAVVLEIIPAARLPAGDGLPGAASTARVQIAAGARTREQGRLFALFEGQQERLPLVFMGDLAALPFHRVALQQLFASIHLVHAQSEALY